MYIVEVGTADVDMTKVFDSHKKQKSLGRIQLALRCLCFALLYVAFAFFLCFTLLLLCSARLCLGVLCFALLRFVLLCLALLSFALQGRCFWCALLGFVLQNLCLWFALFHAHQLFLRPVCHACFGRTKVVLATPSNKAAREVHSKTLHSLLGSTPESSLRTSALALTIQ